MKDIFADERKSLIEGLRLMADFLESTPEAPTPSPDLILNVFPDTKEEMREIALILGSVKKSANDNFFTIGKNFGTLRYEANISRGTVCEKTVVGTRVVPEHVVDIVEWKCADSILEPTDA